MKFTLSVAILALAASQAMAVVPIPIADCTKSVIVMPTDTDGCDAFGARNNVTFENMLKWNTKLSPKCDNLDEGHPICVSITKGDCCLADPSAVTTLPVLTTVAPNPTSAPVTSGTTTVGPVTTTTGAVNATTALPTTSVTASTSAPATTTTKASEASGSKSSMLLAAVGVVVSVAYML
ncbi:hypothetical protein BGZ46_008249 [Entomortierella lignicola]|nr:hypothetical protein BGZ46_008249 [Entomortierella lignicola]